MGKYLEKFKNNIGKIDERIKNMSNERPVNDRLKPQNEQDYNSEYLNDPLFNDLKEDGTPKFDEVCIQQSQKPESFHHFILENQYKDLERSIRGYKDVFDKETSTWKTKRKEEHCFTDEEAEEILRTAQSHLATDIKLGFVNKESFPILMDTIYQELAFLFRRIAEYNYGRYGSYEKQGQMKLQNLKIFLELFTRIQANYSRSISGIENKYTHESVKGQESLQNRGNMDMMMGRRYM